MNYEIRFRFDLGKAVAPVGELANELNGQLAKFGCDEKLAICSELPPMSLQVSRPLTTDEQTQVKKLITQQVQAAFPTWNVQLVSFYHKPGNVAQSAQQ